MTSFSAPTINSACHIDRHQPVSRRRPPGDNQMSVNITKPIYRTVPGLIRFWSGQIRTLIRMFRGVIEVCREVIDVAVEPRQRAHRVRLALRHIAGWICAVKHTRFDQRSRRTGDRRTERTRDIGIAVMARDAIGAIDHFAAIDRAQFARLAACRDDQRDRDPQQRGARGAEPVRDRTAEGAADRVAAVTASARAPQSPRSR